MRLTALLSTLAFTTNILARAIPPPFALQARAAGEGCISAAISSTEFSVKQFPPTPQLSLGDAELANGLGLNIMAQQGELAATNSLISLGNAKSMDPTLYNTSRDNLMTFLKAGIRIRQNNMVLGEGKAAIRTGLSEVEEAQLTETDLANQLSGNAEKDLPVLKQLAIDFQAGMMKNTGLQAMVVNGV